MNKVIEILESKTRNKTEETILEAYKRNICSNCKNNNKKTEEPCHITWTIDGKLRCPFYDRANKQEGYKKPLKTTAKQQKPIMKDILK